MYREILQKYVEERVEAIRRLVQEILPAVERLFAGAKYSWYSIDLEIERCDELYCAHGCMVRLLTARLYPEDFEINDVIYELRDIVQRAAWECYMSIIDEAVGYTDVEFSICIDDLTGKKECRM